MSNMERGVLLAKTSPAFLHANSTSHTWIFSAIAELIDNAYDPDVHASVLRIDVENVPVVPGQMTCITFTDNGSGLTPEKLHNMLSFGYCEKAEIGGTYKPVGQYGNGFKSGSMRIGRDAIVFTMDFSTMSVGLLSQSYLEAVKAETILVPIISWDKKTMKIVDKLDTAGSLRSIRGHSIFTSTSALLKQFDYITHETGTRIVIYNLKTGADGKFELDFESVASDIINSEHHEMDAVYRPVVDYTPEYRRSLREYCAILFLKPRMKIILRNKKVKTKLIARSLKKMQVDTYKPRFLSNPVRITFGFGPTEDCGVMLYHRNRLIKAYEKVGCQKQMQINPLNSGNNNGAGIVGVVEADFLDPIHNKQEFDKTDRYNSFIHALGQKLNDYRDFVQKAEHPNALETVPRGDAIPWTWAQCDKCAKWRRLPQGFDEELPDVWYCYMNRDAAHNRCDIDEEPEDEDAIMEQSATYTKLVSKQKNAEKSQRVQNIRNKEKDLERKTQELERAKLSMDDRARKDLEVARMALEEAQRREADQQRMIQMLERENRLWKTKQRQLGEGIMANGSQMASINEIARHGSRTATAPDGNRSGPSTSHDSRPSSAHDITGSVGSSPFTSTANNTFSTPQSMPERLTNISPISAMTSETGHNAAKRKNSSAAAGAAKKARVDGGGDALSSLPAADSDTEIDSKEALHSTLVIKLPGSATKSASSTSVIVINDSDETDTDDDNAVVCGRKLPTDIKPDASRLAELNTVDNNTTVRPTATNSMPVTSASIQNDMAANISQSASGVKLLLAASRRPSPANAVQRPPVANGSISSVPMSSPVAGTPKSSASQSSLPAGGNSPGHGAPVVTPSPACHNASIPSIVDRISFPKKKKSKFSPHSSPLNIRRPGVKSSPASSPSKCISKLLPPVSAKGPRPSAAAAAPATAAALVAALADATVASPPSAPSFAKPAERSMRCAGVQTEFEDSAVVRQLSALRGNVLQLLKTIVPSLDCGRLEYVDDLVIEMVRVNAQSDDDVKSENNS